MIEMHKTPTSKPKNELAYDLWATDYDRQIPPHALLEEPHMVQLVSPCPGDRILDLACGTGRLSRIWQQNGADVTGVDISSKMLDCARAKVPEARFLHADLNEPLCCAENNSFDKVSCSLAIKHIKNLDLLFTELMRITTNSSRLVFSTIHPQMNWSTYERLSPSSVEVNDLGETFPYEIADICKIACGSGWVITESRENNFQVD